MACHASIQIDLSWFQSLVTGLVHALSEAVHSFRDVIIIFLFEINVFDTLPEISTLFSDYMWSILGLMERRIAVDAVESMGITLAILLLFDTAFPVLLFVYMLLFVVFIGLWTGNYYQIMRWWGSKPGKGFLHS